MYYVVIDTETCDGQGRTLAYPSPRDALIYDIGWLIVDSTGEVVERRSIIVSDTFNRTDIMASAYYADKVPGYVERIRRGEVQTMSALDAFHLLAYDVERYRVRDAWAYNARFDRTVIDATISHYSNGFANLETMFPRIRFRDIWDYASCITGTRPYVEWCETHGFVSAKGNPVTNAERVYGYLTDSPDYVESHTALADCYTELTILQAAKRRKKRTRHTMGQGWRDAARVAREMHEED